MLGFCQVMKPERLFGFRIGRVPAVIGYCRPWPHCHMRACPSGGGFALLREQPLNILEVVGLRAPTAVAECRRHSAKSRPSLRIEQALRSRRWDSICCGKQPLNILEVVGLRAPTAVAECHRHSAKSRLSLRMKQALRSGRWDSFSSASNH